MFLSDSDLGKLRACVHDELEIISFTNCRTLLFLTSTLTNTLFQFPEYVKQHQEIRRACTLKQFLRHAVWENTSQFANQN